MNEENIDFVIDWFEKYNNLDYNLRYAFKDLKKPISESQQFSAIQFLYKKLKDPKNKYFLQGSHDELYIGSWDDFKEFTEKDLIEMAHYGIDVDPDESGFIISASM